MEAARAYATLCKAEGSPTTTGENECNFYVGPGDGGMRDLAMESLVGIRLWLGLGLRVNPIYTCIHIYIYAHTHIHTHTHIDAHAHTHIDT